MDLMLVAAGALTGFLVGLTGVGGGALMTPLLLLLFGMAPLAAVGTDLWFAAITKLFASRVHAGEFAYTCFCVFTHKLWNISLSL